MFGSPPLPALQNPLAGLSAPRLVDLEPITKLANLERLSLMDNPVTKASPGLDEWDEWGVGSGGWAGRSWDAMLDPGVGTPGLPQEL